MKNKLFKKIDIALIVLLLLAAVLTVLLLPGGGNSVVIYDENGFFADYPLDIDTTVVISEHNTIEIKSGRVSMTFSDCPDLHCKRQGSIDRGSITCLPNKLIISIENKAEPGYDAVTGGEAQ